MTLIGYLLCAMFCVFCELPLKGGAEKKRGGRGGEETGVGETGRRGKGDGKLDDSNKKRKEAWRRSYAFTEKYYFT